MSTATATSPRTLIRDAIVSAFEQSDGSLERRVSEYGVSVKYLTETELKQAAVYCVIVSDEARAEGNSLQRDMVSATVKLVLWANDPSDPREKLDRMIEDACDTLRNAFQVLRADRTIVSGALDEIQSDEATTAAGPLAQAVMRLSVLYQRPAVMV
jgi:hypothetical protein